MGFQFLLFQNMRATSESHQVQKIRKCQLRAKFGKSKSIFKIYETISLLKESEGETYRLLVKKAREDFNIPENERFIISRLMELLIKKNVNVKIVNIGSLVKEAITNLKIESRQNEEMLSETTDTLPRSILKKQRGRHEVKMS